MEHRERRNNSWFWRRLLAYALVTFSMTLLVWLSWNGVQDGRLHLLIAEGCLWLLGAVFMVYVAGATTDDLVSLTKSVRGIADNSKETK